MEVMQILTENGCSEDVIVAGILHDTLEDTPTTPEQIVEKFGKRILELVQSQSEDKSKSWRERKQHTIDMMKDADKDVQLICCADKLSNIKSIYADKQIVGEAVFDRFNASKEDIRWYYESLAHGFTKIDDYKMKHELKTFVDKVFHN
jgi:(p)ppGpp synthase/HD superfamily hydrolase